MENKQITTQAEGNQQLTTTFRLELPSLLAKCLSNKNIDWYGNCNFDENGKVVSFKFNSSANHYKLLPVPKGVDVTKDAMKVDLMLKSILKKPSSNEIAVCLKRVSLHCGMQSKTPQETGSMFKDYCMDLSSYPVMLIEEACKAIRIDPNIKFLPSSGKFIELITPKLDKLKLMQFRINLILGKENEKEQKKSKKTIQLSKVLEDMF